MIAQLAPADIDDAVVAAFARLIPQLSKAPPPDRAALADIAARAVVLVARQAGAIVGTLTLTLYRIPTGLQARIDDVVVDGAARGAGVGAALVDAAIARARAAGARGIALTSAPERAAANRLYRRLGFVQRHTNVYKLPLDS